MEISKDDLKKILSEYPQYDSILRELEKEMDKACKEVDDENLELKATQYTGMPHGSGVSNPTRDLALRRIEQKEKRLKRLRENHEEILCKRTIVEMFLESMTSVKREIIEMRHFSNFSWEEISNFLGLSRITCIRRHNAILEECLSVLQEDHHPD